VAQIEIRNAAPEDVEPVFRWRNDPVILVRGSSQRAVPWDEHQRWFEETLRGERRKMFIVVQSGQPVGQVRFDRTDNRTGVISVYLLPPFTGRGHGVEAIRLGCAEIFKLWEIDGVVACVRLDNPWARSAFLKAGFVEKAPPGCCPEAHFALSLARPGALDEACQP
jgi:RimJ/RimL family protein N-acetyltransferase